MMPRKRTFGVNRSKPHLIMDVVNYPPPYKRVEIRTIDGQSIWSLFRTYFNKLNIGAEFNRVDLLHSVYVPDAAKAMRRVETTVDQYKRYVGLLYCLEKTGWGKYKKLKDIPDLPVTKIRDYVYDKSWKSWFIPVEDF